MHLCGMNYKYFSQHRYKCNSFGCTAAIRCGNACRGPHSDSLYSGSEHRQFNSPRLVKREAGFPNPRRALIGSNQLWRVNDSPYHREYFNYRQHQTVAHETWFWLVNHKKNRKSSICNSLTGVCVIPRDLSIIMSSLAIRMLRRLRRAAPYFFNIMLSHTEDLLTPPYDIRAVAIPYVGLNISSVWTITISHGGLR